MRMYGMLLLALTISLTGCATILSGYDQKIDVTTNPPGAECELLREGERIASLPSTPASTVVRKTKEDITLLCKKDGYMPSQTTLTSGADSRTYANIIFGAVGLVLWSIDSIGGADNHYPDSPALTLASSSEVTSTPSTRK